jgi:hypothetical protein
MTVLPSAAAGFVPSEVTDPAHCVEGGPPVVRPVFSECKQAP